MIYFFTDFADHCRALIFYAGIARFIFQNPLFYPSCLLRRSVAVLLLMQPYLIQHLISFAK